MERKECSRMSKARRLFVSFGIGAVLMFGVSVLRTIHAQAPAAEPAAAPEAAAPAATPSVAPAAAPAVAVPDPTGDITGTAADVPVKDAQNPTLPEVMAVVGHNKIATNIVWVLLTGFLVMFM